VGRLAGSGAQARRLTGWGGQLKSGRSTVRSCPWPPVPCCLISPLTCTDSRKKEIQMAVQADPYSSAYLRKPRIPDTAVVPGPGIRV